MTNYNQGQHKTDIWPKLSQRLVMKQRKKCREQPKLYPLDLYPGPTIPSQALPAVGQLWPSGDDDDLPSCLDYYPIYL